MFAYVDPARRAGRARSGCSRTRRRSSQRSSCRSGSSTSRPATWVQRGAQVRLRGVAAVAGALPGADVHEQLHDLPGPAARGARPGAAPARSRRSTARCARSAARSPCCSRCTSRRTARCTSRPRCARTSAAARSSPRLTRGPGGRAGRSPGRLVPVDASTAPPPARRLRPRRHARPQRRHRRAAHGRGAGPRRGGRRAVRHGDRPAAALDGGDRAQTGHRGLAVCANGALVYDLHTEQVVQSSLLDEQAAVEVAAALREALPDIAFAVERAGPRFGHEEPYLPRPGAPDHRPLPVEQLVSGGVVKLLARHRGLYSDALLAAAREAVGDRATLTHSSNDGLLEVSAAGTARRPGSPPSPRQHGVEAAQVVAFGDMPNDLPMLAWAGHAVAVANAHPEVLELADEVTARNDEDGVAAGPRALVLTGYGPYALPRALARRRRGGAAPRGTARHALRWRSTTGSTSRSSVRRPARSACREAAVDQAVAEWRAGLLAPLPPLPPDRRAGLPGWVAVEGQVALAPDGPASGSTRGCAASGSSGGARTAPRRTGHPASGVLASARRAADLDRRLRLGMVGRVRVCVTPGEPQPPARRSPGRGCAWSPTSATPAAACWPGWSSRRRWSWAAGWARASGCPATSASRCSLALPAALGTGGLGWLGAAQVLRTRSAALSEDLGGSWTSSRTSLPASACPTGPRPGRCSACPASCADRPQLQVLAGARRRRRRAGPAPPAAPAGRAPARAASWPPSAGRTARSGCRGTAPRAIRPAAPAPPAAPRRTAPRPRRTAASAARAPRAAPAPARPTARATDVVWIAARRPRAASSSGAARTSSSSCLTIEPIRMTLAGCSTISAGFFSSVPSAVRRHGHGAERLAVGPTTTTWWAPSCSGGSCWPG